MVVLNTSKRDAFLNCSPGHIYECRRMPGILSSHSQYKYNITPMNRIKADGKREQEQSSLKWTEL